MSGHSDVFGGWGPGLEKALERSGDTHTLEDLREAIANGWAHIWPADECCVVTIIHDYPKRRVLRVWLGTGKWQALERALSVADNLARECGCDGVEIEGRKGWSRRLAGHGYKLERVVLTKDV